MPVSQKRKLKINKKTQKGGSRRPTPTPQPKSIYNLPSVPKFDPGFELPNVPKPDPLLKMYEESCNDSQHILLLLNKKINEYKIDYIDSKSKLNLTLKEKQINCLKFNRYMKKLYDTKFDATEIIINTLAPAPPTKTPMSSRS